jgi:hypothetical protein
MMFEFLPLLYAALGGGAVATVGAHWLQKLKAEERTRTLKRALHDVQALQAVKVGTEAAEAAAMAAREAALLQQVKEEAAKL